MISQSQVLMKGHQSQKFMLQLQHKSANLAKECFTCCRLHSSGLVSNMHSGIGRLTSSGLLRGAQSGVESQRAHILNYNTSAATPFYYNKRYYPSKKTREQLQNKTDSMFLRVNAESLNTYRIVLPSSCDSVRLYSNKTLEKTITNDTISLNSQSNKVLDVLHSDVQISHSKLPQVHNVKNNLKVSDKLNDIEAETDFVYGGRRESQDVQPSYSSALSHQLINEDGVEAPLPSEVRAENIKALSHLISNAETCFDVFHIYEEHQNQLNFLHYDLIVKRLSSVIDRTPLAEVYSNTVFVHLCERLCKNCCQYDPPMLLSLLEMLNTIKLSPDALIMMTTQQMLRKKFDSLDVKELLLLDKLLSNKEQGVLGSALKKAVPLALECMYSSLELPNSLSPSHLSHGLLVCANSDSIESLALADKFMMMLYECEQGVDELSVSEAVALITGLLKVFQRWTSIPERQQQQALGEEDPFEPNQLSMGNSELCVEKLAATREVLLQEALHLMALNLSQLTDSQLEELLSLVSCAYKQGDRSAHCQALLDAFVRRVLEQETSLQTMAAGVTWMLKMDAVDGSLVQALLEKLLLAPSEELGGLELSVLPLLHALAASNGLQGRPKEQCHTLLRQLVQHSSIQLQSQGGEPTSHTRLAVDLACLGYFDPAIHVPLLACAATNARKCLDGSLPGSGVRQFVAICQAQQLLASQHGPLQVDEKLLLECKEFLLNSSHLSKHHSAERALVRQLLQHSLSSHGPNSVVTRVHTTHGVLIDHVLVTSGSGEVVPQPAAVDGDGQRSICLNDLTVPDGSRVVGVVQVGPGLLLNNYSVMRPLVRLELQLLAAEGVTVVPLMMPTLMLHCSTDQDKLEYVLEALRQHNLCLSH